MTQAPNTFHITFTRLFIGLAIVTLLIGCGAGNGQGLDENGNLLGSGGGGGGGGTGNATLSWVQTNVFGGVCTQCHTGASPPLGVNWSSENDTCSNVGRASGWDSSMMEINSGNPDMSYVIWKLEGAGPNGEAILGEQMPAGGNPPLTAEAIQNIRDWIADGTPGCSTPLSENSTAALLNEPESGSTYTEGSWMSVWNDSLQVCASCHSLAPSSPRCSVDFECPPNGVVLTADNYFGVVDGNTVAPYDLARSNLWNRVIEENTETRMPLGFDALTQAQLDTIQSWIEAGAPF